MSSSLFAAARGFIYMQARVLERRLFAALFEGEPSAGVVDAVRGHRNADGGFGHGLESDLRCPHSQPIHVEIALLSLDAVGELRGELVEDALDYLDRTSPDGGVAAITADALDYPHAPHWARWDLASALNPTAGLVAVCLKNQIDHPWLARARRFCDAALETGDWGEAHSLLEVLRLAEVTGREDIVRDIGTRLPGTDGFKSDARAPEYGVTPLQYAPHPESIGATLFSEELLQEHLNALADAQQDDGGWPLTWTPPSTASTLEWRGFRTLEALRIMDSYGMLRRSTYDSDSRP